MGHKKRDVLITGASGTIGGAIAKRLARAGYTLHLAARQTGRLAALRKELALLQPSFRAYALDLKSFSSCQKLCRAFFSHATEPFALVSAAGNLGTPGRFMDVEFSSWGQGFSENFLAQAALVHAFSKEVVKRKTPDARIAVFSGAGIGGMESFANVTSYGAAKAALVHLVEALAEEFLPHGIAINAIAPGAVLSRITEQAIKAGVGRIGKYASDALKCRDSGGVSPDLAAELVEFLLSEKACGVSGRLLSARFDQNALKAGTGEIANDPNRYRLRRIDNDLFMPAVKTGRS